MAPERPDREVPGGARDGAPGRTRDPETRPEQERAEDDPDV